MRICDIKGLIIDNDIFNREMKVIIKDEKLLHYRFELNVQTLYAVEIKRRNIGLTDFLLKASNFEFPLQDFKAHFKNDLFGDSGRQFVVDHDERRGDHRWLRGTVWVPHPQCMAGFNSRC